MENIKEKRLRVGKLAGIVGIAANILLFAVKVIIGIFTGSIAAVADAINNLSDAGSSVFVLVGYHLSGKPAGQRRLQIYGADCDPGGRPGLRIYAGLLLFLRCTDGADGDGTGDHPRDLRPAYRSGCGAVLRRCCTGLRLPQRRHGNRNRHGRRGVRIYRLIWNQ